MGREIAFHEDFKRVTDDLRILVAKGADALLQFGERAKVGSQASWAQEASVEDRACIIKAAAKLPKITGLEIAQSRAVPQGHAQGRHDPDLYHVKVEIDVNVAGQRSTYIFNCIHSGEFTVIQPLGMR